MNSLAQARDLLAEHFNLEELQQLCLDLGIRYENIAGATITAKSQSLVDYCRRYGLLSELLRQCREQRPKVTWPELSAAGDAGVAAVSREAGATSAAAAKPARARARYAPFTELFSPQLLDDIYPGLSTAVIAGRVGDTRNSHLEKCLVGAKWLVVKRTPSRLCAADALKHLVGKSIVGHESKVSARIATPLAVWEGDEYVWELHPFYEGITLRDLVRSNSYAYGRVTHNILGAIFNALCQAVESLQAEGILHRDISPTNILISPGDDPSVRLTLVDCSFCCFMDQPQKIRVYDPNYSAPEAASAPAVRQSDWYAIAATVYFLSNQRPPNVYDRQTLRQGLLNVNSGHYWPSYSFPFLRDSILYEQPFAARLDQFDRNWVRTEYTIGLVLERLLVAQPADRPDSLKHLYLETGSVALDPGPTGFISALKVGDQGCLLIEGKQFAMMNKEAAISRISNAGDMAFEREEARAEVLRFLLS